MHVYVGTLPYRPTYSPDIVTVVMYLPICKTLMSVADCTNQGGGQFSWDRDTTSDYNSGEALPSSPSLGR